MVSTEEIVLERRSASGGKAEETSTSGDSLAQMVKELFSWYARLVARRVTTGHQGVLTKDLSSQAEEFMTDRPPSADATAASSIANNSTYVAPKQESRLREKHWV